MLSSSICLMLLVGKSVLELQVNCNRVDYTAVELALDNTAAELSLSLELRNQSNDIMTIAALDAHETVLSKYGLECRCARECQKISGSMFRGHQSCKIHRIASNDEPKYFRCVPKDKAYMEHCQELVQPAVNQDAIRCDPSTHEELEQTAVDTRLPQSVGKAVQTNLLTFDECVAEVLRRSATNRSYQKEVQMRISSTREVRIEVGTLVITMPMCRCRKMWIRKPLEPDEAAEEGPGCSRICKPRTDHSCKRPELSQLSNEICRKEVLSYCANGGTSCAQSWQCVHQGECREEERVQTMTKTASEKEFLSQCHYCCKVTYHTPQKRGSGPPGWSCSSSGPDAVLKWLKEGQACTGTSRSKSGHNGHGTCIWSARADKKTDLDKGSCSGGGGFSHLDDDDGYPGSRASSSDLEC